MVLDGPFRHLKTIAVHQEETSQHFAYMLLSRVSKLLASKYTSESSSMEMAYAISLKIVNANC